MSRRAQIWLALWTVYILWGSTYLGIELVAETMPGTFAAGVRFAVAGLLLLVFIAWRRGRAALRVTRAELASAALIGVLLLGANSVLFITEQKVPIGLTSLIVAAIPLWVLLLRLLTGERPDLLSTIGLAVGFAGVILLVRPGGSSGPLGYLLLTVLATTVWALGSFISPRLQLPRDPFVSTGFEMVCAGLVLLAVGLPTAGPGELDPSTYSGRSIAGLVYLIVAGSIVGYSAYVWLLANAPIGQVATHAYVNPVIAIALGAIVLDEAVSWRIVGGALLVLLAVAVVVRRESAATDRPDRPAEPELEPAAGRWRRGALRRLPPWRRPSAARPRP